MSTASIEICYPAISRAASRVGMPESFLEVVWNPGSDTPESLLKLDPQQLQRLYCELVAQGDLVCANVLHDGVSQLLMAESGDHRLHALQLLATKFSPDACKEGAGPPAG